MAELLVQWRDRGAFAFLLGLSIFLLAQATFGHKTRAATAVFADREVLVKLQDVGFMDLDGERLYLGYKYSYSSFLAPYQVSDDGYIIGITGKNRYYSLGATLTAALQAKGQLPNPLPPYRLPPLVYLFGHLLWLLAAGFLMSIYFATRGHARSRSAVPFVSEGMALERAGNLELAVDAYSRGLVHAPASIDLLCSRANAFHNAGDFDRAIADFSRALTLEPKHAMALLGRGSAFEAKGLIQAAIDDYGRAIQISGSALAYFARGIAQLAVGDNRAAIDDFTRVIALEPTLIAAYQNRALAYGRAGALDEARADQAAIAAIVSQARPRVAARL
jgi:tetratricopeptide (TPR) repeat protein